MSTVHEIETTARLYTLGDPERGLRNREVWPEICRPDVVLVATPGLPELRGVETFQKIAGKMADALTDFDVRIDELIATEDKAVIRWYAAVTAAKAYVHPLTGLEIPEGKRVVRTGITILRFRHGKVAEETTYEDRLGLLEQLGVVPAAT